MKKMMAMAACTLLAASMITGCGGSSSTATKETTAAKTETTAAAATSELPELTAAMCEEPVLLTSVGQSADISVVETLFKKAEIPVTVEAVADTSKLDGVKTLVLAIGGSTKGLGAAGIDENQEVERVQGLIAEAQSKDIKIVALHIGGSARRGTLSDKFIPDALNAANAAIIVSEGDSDNMMKDDIKIVALHIGGSARRGTLSDKFIPDALNAANAAIIVSEGDSDNMMKDILASHSTPSAYITSQIDAVDCIKTIFGK